MTAQRFFIDSYQDGSPTVLLRDEEFHHLARVLRKSPGAMVEILNGRGCIGTGIVKTIDRDVATIQMTSCTVQERSQPDLHLAVALPKSETVYDDIIKHCTQLGVSRFYPLTSARSRHLNRSSLPNRMDRWRRIVVNSCKQCRQPWFPGMSEPSDLADFISEKQSKSATIFMGWEPGILESTTMGNLSVPLNEPVIWLVGPEGGWTDQEKWQLDQSGIQSLRLGSFILTTDVACVAGSALIIAHQKRSVPDT